jgi:hypothetical protein
MQNFGAGSASLWGDGDFDFDGAVTLADLAMLGGHFSPTDVMSNAAAVPEPSAARQLSGIVALLGIVLFFRRRALPLVSPAKRQRRGGVAWN